MIHFYKLPDVINTHKIFSMNKYTLIFFLSDHCNFSFFFFYYFNAWEVAKCLIEWYKPLLAFLQVLKKSIHIFTTVDDLANSFHRCFLLNCRIFPCFFLWKFYYNTVFNFDKCFSLFFVIIEMITGFLLSGELYCWIYNVFLFCFTKQNFVLHVLLFLKLLLDLFCKLITLNICLNFFGLL